MKYIAHVIKGIESIAQEEIQNLQGITNILTSQKKIIFDFDGDIKSLSKLRIVDDISLFINEFDSGDPENIINRSELSNAINFLKERRELKGYFSLTVSIFKNKNYTQEGLKSKLSDILQKELGMEYISRDHTNLDIRINIDEDHGTVSLKLFPQSLFIRNYDHTPEFGSIRPTIAAAIIYFLKSKTEGNALVDNFCGSGTFLCEGFLQGQQVFGGDIEKSKVETSIKNLEKVGCTDLKVTLQDGLKTDWENKQFDIGVSNLPWGKQIKLKDIQSLYSGVVREYRRILKSNGVLGIISANPDLIKKYIEHSFPNHIVQEFKLGYLGQTPTITFAFPKTN